VREKEWISRSVNWKKKKREKRRRVEPGEIKRKKKWKKKQPLRKPPKLRGL